jgi:hypothetical protein
MKSRLAQQARQALAADIAGMTPEQRLAAFLAHCQLIMALRSAALQVPVPQSGAAQDHGH